MQALMAEGRRGGGARATAGARVASFTRMVEADARRRIAEEKGPSTSPTSPSARPSTGSTSPRCRGRPRGDAPRDLPAGPAARDPADPGAPRPRRGPLDFRRTVRASISTGGVPLTTHHKPKRPHRTELVVLCDVSGSVANFAQFTLMLVFALRDQFSKVRAFTFVDHVHEVTHHFGPAPTSST
jgi:hypothetical protein